MTTSWSAQTSHLGRHGAAATRIQAWQLALEAAVQLATATNGTEAIALAVGEETAHLFPAADAAHRYDPDATREFAQQLVAALNGTSVGAAPARPVPDASG
jgi:hypothetical protein